MAFRDTLTAVYGIVRAPSFDVDGAQLVGGIKRLDHLLTALEWVLSRDPFVFSVDAGASFRVAVTRFAPPADNLWVYFRVLEEERLVELLQVEVYPAQ